MVRSDELAQVTPLALPRRLAAAVRGLAARPWIALPLLALPAWWPFLTLGLPQSADGTLHLMRLMLLDHHLQQGMLFPRWLPELVLGHGYPVFSYYAPASYYVAEALHLLGLGYEPALMAAFCVFVLLGGLGMYLLARTAFGAGRPDAALVAATAYMYAPYLLTNVYVRGALAEVGAQALLPWIVWSAWRVMEAEEPARYVPAAALSLAGLALMHNITLLFVPPLWCGLVLVLWLRGRRELRRLVAPALSAGLALALSAFFILPLVGERQYLSGIAYDISRQFLPENVWTWATFLDLSFVFHLTFAVPFRLGLIQLLLAVAGVLVARRRDAVWLLFLGVAALGSLAIGAWAMPIWLSSQTLLIAQFPWRLLGIVTIPLALFAGGCLLRVRKPALRAGLTVALLALIIVTNRPQIGWMDLIPRDDGNLDLPAVAQLEATTAAMGTSAAQEFRPRWAGGPGYMAGPGDGSVGLNVSLQAANVFGLAMRADSAAGGPLRFGSYYFPGWHVRVDGAEARTYPSTNLGLLTVDLPAGAHDVRVAWQATPLQRVSTALSLLALAGAALFYARRRSRRWLALPFAGLLAFGLVATFNRPPLAAVQIPAAPAGAADVDLLGYRLDPPRASHLLVYPYWYVRRTPAAEWRARWQVRDAGGRLISETQSRPWYNALPASDWPAGTVEDDAYRVPLPPGLPAGTYQIWLAVDGGPGQAGEAHAFGSFSLARTVPPNVEPAHALDLRYGTAIVLAGYDQAGGQAAGAAPLIAHAGEALDYTLYWRGTGAVAENYSGFVHLVDAAGKTLATCDKIAGGWLMPSGLWSASALSPDGYRLRLPADAPSGLYWPAVGLYTFKTLERLPISDAAGADLGDAYRLPPVKVLGPPAGPPSHALSARLGTTAGVLGYDLGAPAGRLRAGDSFTVTLYFRSEAATAVDYRRFLHLYSTELGMAAQADGVPGAGNNPTWAWVAAETIKDVVTLQVEPGARPGRYSLRAGLYDPAAGGARLPAADAQGRPLPDDQVILAEIDVQP